MMKNDTLIFVALAGVAALFVFNKSGGAATPASRPAGGGNAANAPRPPSSTNLKGTASPYDSLASDVSNYTRAFGTLTGGLSDLYDRYFSGDSSASAVSSGYDNYDYGDE